MNKENARSVPTYQTWGENPGFFYVVEKHVDSKGAVSPSNGLASEVIGGSSFVVYRTTTEGPKLSVADPSMSQYDRHMAMARRMYDV